MISVRRLKTLSLFIILTFVCHPFSAYSLPQGGTVVGGDAKAKISTPTSKYMKINQHADKVIINYNSFSIGQPETVRFFQPAASSIALNRVQGADPSQILGTLKANGRIFLVNPNGVLFGPGCKIDTSGMLASTLNIKNKDFLAGRYTFFNDNSKTVENRGYISQPGGFVALLGTSVLNSGIIEAETGSIALASGDALTLKLDPAGIVSVVIDSSASVNTKAQDSAIINNGIISADGGKVIITAKTLDTVFDKAINNQGLIEAKDLVSDNGRIVLTANNDITLSGPVYGGKVKVVSKQGNVTHTADGDVVTAGGDFRGYAGKDYILRNGSAVITGDGTIDIFAGNNIVLGTAETDIYTDYYWQYICGTRGYKFTEFGYYMDTASGLVYVPFVSGQDIGKDKISLRSGSGTVFGSIDFDLYTISKNYKGNLLTWHEDPVLNADGKIHVKDTERGYGWEDLYNLGDKDYDDEVIHFYTKQRNFSPGSYLASNSRIFLTAENGSIAQAGGKVLSQDLMLSAAKGISGTGPCSSFQTQTKNISALNTDTGDIALSNNGKLAISDLSREKGLNPGVYGYQGITNQAEKGKIDVKVYEFTSDYIIDGKIDDWKVDLFAFNSDKKKFLDFYRPSGGLDIDFISEDNADNYTCWNYVGPGYSTKNTNDVEAVYLDNDGEYLYLAIVSGVKKSCISGDIALDTNKDGIYEYGIRLSDESLYSLGKWINPGFSSSQPWKINCQKTLLEPVDLVYSNDQNSHYVIETRVPLASLGLKKGDCLTAHWTMKCGNDVLNLAGDINRLPAADLIVAAPVQSKGNISFYADRNIIQKAKGDITISGVNASFLPAPNVLESTSHSTSVWTNEGEIDFAWSLEKPADLWYGNFKAKAGGRYTMQKKSQIDTNGGDVSIFAKNNINLTDIDASIGTVNITSARGSIIDQDKGFVFGPGPYPYQNDLDIVANAIYLSAPQGKVGGPALGDEIDIANPFTFSYLADTNDLTDPDTVPDYFEARLTNSGTWAYSTRVTTNADSDNWWFHLATVADGNTSNTVHSGPYFIDMTAPVIFAGAPIGLAGNNGWWRSALEIPFSAEDNLSGFDPSGELQTTLASKFLLSEGRGLTVTSDGIFDRAGNPAKIVTSGPFKIDWTAPKITAGTPQGTQRNNGSWATNVTVPFSATDNLSGFEPKGDLYTDMAAKTTVRPGSDLYVTSEGIYDMAGNFAAGIPAGPFDVIFDDGSRFGNQQYFRAYYELLDNYRVVFADPAQPTEYYAYHPLIPTDTAAFDNIALNADAYDFIVDRIHNKEKFAPYFGEEEKEDRKKKKF